MIKAIETVFDGFRFRSRLEARWSLFFRELGVEYEYEKEGFTIASHGNYLPDFWLPLNRIWVEIKGEYPTVEYYRMLKAFRTQVGNAVLVATGLPTEKPMDLIAWNMETIKQLRFSECEYGDIQFLSAHGGEITGLLTQDRRVRAGATIYADAKFNMPMQVHYFKENSISLAALKAKQARFEHGEKP